MGSAVRPGFADVVIGLYEQGFVRAFETHRQYDRYGCIGYTNLGWGTAQVPTLVAAIKYVEAHCRPKDEEGKEDAQLELELGCNKFTAAEKAQLRAALRCVCTVWRGCKCPGRSTKFALDLM